MMKKLIGYFVKGLLVTVPLAVTIYAVYFVFAKIDGLLPIPIPGVGFAATIIFITLVGFLASSILAKGLMRMLDNLFSRIPFVKLVYSALKDLMNAFVGEKKMFDRPVLVRLSKDIEARVIGFITQDDLSNLGIRPVRDSSSRLDDRAIGAQNADSATPPNMDTLSGLNLNVSNGVEDSVAVYLPQSYNFAGNLIIVPRNQIQPLDKSGPEVMAFIVSAGLSKK